MGVTGEELLRGMRRAKRFRGLYGGERINSSGAEIGVRTRRTEILRGRADEFRSVFDRDVRHRLVNERENPRGVWSRHRSARHRHILPAGSGGKDVDAWRGDARTLERAAFPDGRSAGAERSDSVVLIRRADRVSLRTSARRSDRTRIGTVVPRGENREDPELHPRRERLTEYIVRRIGRRRWSSATP